jgi:hypothetical protein
MLAAAFSCGASSEDRQVVAEYRSEKLTLGQLRAMLPPSQSAADSTRMAQLYIRQWQTEQVLAEAARNQVPDLERRIADRVADARRKIMIDELRTYLVQDETESLISPQMIESYYKDHIEEFIAPTFLFQFRYVVSASKDLELLRQRIVSDQPQDQQLLLKWAEQQATEFRLDDQFVEGQVLMAIQTRFKQDLSRIEAKSPPLFVEAEGPKGPVYLLFYMREVIKPGKYIPLEHVSDRIRRTLVFKRQNERIAAFEAKVLHQARASGALR